MSKGSSRIQYRTYKINWLVPAKEGEVRPSKLLLPANKVDEVKAILGIDDTIAEVVEVS